MDEITLYVCDECDVVSNQKGECLQCGRPFLKKVYVPQDELTAQLRLAFVAGAKWWEYKKENATMWQSDQHLAGAEALRRWPDVQPSQVGCLFTPLPEQEGEK